MPEDPPGFFQSVIADKIGANHYHIIFIDNIQDGFIRFQTTGSQELPRGVDYYRNTHIMQQVDSGTVEDKGIGCRRHQGYDA